MNKLNELLLNFIDYMKNIKNRSMTFERYYYHIRKFNQYIVAKKGNIGPKEIELIDVINFFNYYKTRKIKAGPRIGQYPTRNSLYNVIVSIRMFFKYLTLIGTQLKFNREQIPIYKMEEMRREPMKKDEYELLLSAPRIYNDPNRKDIILRDQLLFEIPRETGLRRSEVARLKFEYFHSPNRQFQIEVKGGRFESVFFSEALQKKVFEYEKIVNEKYKFKDIEYLFFNMGQKLKGKRIPTENIGLIVANYIKKLKKDGLIPEDKKLCLHMERHSFAMRCVYSGLSQQATTALMRHKDPKITLYYYHLNDNWLKNEYDKING